MRQVDIWPVTVRQQVSAQVSENVWMDARRRLRGSLSRSGLGNWFGPSWGPSWRRQLGAPLDNIDYYITGPGLIRDPDAQSLALQNK